MRVKRGVAVSLAVAAVLAAGCGGRGTIAAPSNRAISPLDSGLEAPLSARELAAEAAARAKVGAQLRAGYIFQISAAVNSIEVAIGRKPKFTLSHGDFIDVELVPGTEPKYLIRRNPQRTRATASLTDDCDECGDGDSGSATPSPGPTPPPNYGPCSSSGGATWFNNATGEGGCTPRGTSKALTCGTWSWSSRGRGSLIVPNTGTIPDLDYVIDNGDGSCRAGFT